MGIASIVHLYVFPATPYELMGDRISGSVSVLGDYASTDPLDPDEVRDSERPTKLRLPHPDVEVRSGMTLGESVRDVFIGGGGYVRFLHTFDEHLNLLALLNPKTSAVCKNPEICSLLEGYQSCASHRNKLVKLHMHMVSFYYIYHCGSV